ncbi:hypothetical protein [Brevibacillus agri]|uniref:hypothetical protein n=1 Tax=Brevibacillus agri TaxID=51101 RepID=UPI003D752872
MSFQQKCAKCRSKKIDFTETINRPLYISIYAAVLVVLGGIGVSVKGTPVIFLFLGLMGAFVLFAVRMHLEKKKFSNASAWTVASVGKRLPTLHRSRRSNEKKALAPPQCRLQSSKSRVVHARKELFQQTGDRSRFYTVERSPVCVMAGGHHSRWKVRIILLLRNLLDNQFQIFFI